MKTDYKIWYVIRNDDVHINEAGVRFYEGEVTTKNEIDRSDNDTVKSVTRYRRAKRLSHADMPHFRFRKVRKDAKGEDVVVFNVNDFGVISTDEELVTFLNAQIKKDKTREVVDEQDERKLRAVRRIR